MTHKGELNSHLNKPNVDQDKACARLLLHKSLQDKYKFIRDRFSSVPIEDLLMSREDRKKLKQEAREKQKNKKKGKDNKVVHSEGDWDVEDVEMPAIERKLSDDGELSNDEDDASDGKSSEEDNAIEASADEESTANQSGSESDGNDIAMNNVSENDKSSDSEEEAEENDIGKFVKMTPTKPVNKPLVLSPKVSEAKGESKITPKIVKNLEKKVKDKHKQVKNKNLNEKLLSRKFKKDMSETPVQETKVVDPFFITATGENYMSVVEPRQPDEIKEEHKQGNRKLRRAAMFGHVPKIKPRRDFGPENKFNKNNNSLNKNDSFKKYNNSRESNDNRNFMNKRNNFNSNSQEESKPEKQEKLHPSWEAKKKQSGILPFQGKKIVFDES